MKTEAELRCWRAWVDRSGNVSRIPWKSCLYIDGGVEALGDLVSDKLIGVGDEKAMGE